MISAFSAKGIVVTAILLNGWNDSYPELHEAGLAKRKEAFYYGFNVSTEQGYETTRALLSFMAERYSGAHDDYGRPRQQLDRRKRDQQQLKLELHRSDGYRFLYKALFKGIPCGLHGNQEPEPQRESILSPQTMSRSGRTPI